MKTNHPIRRRSGFSFVEILFAIFILGIGFIMIAALFPVAIQQSQATSAETFARSMGISGVGYLRAVMPATQPAPYTSPQPYDTSSSPIRAYQINSIDPRFAWFPYYTTDSAGNVNRLIIVTMQKTDGKVYTPTDITTGIATQITFMEQQGVLSLRGLDSYNNPTSAPDNAYLFYDSY